ncbi:MAG: UDP-N-acetylmuramoyl-L-alanyl-D-glutamate--2,6-diaminopimelate ligase [Rhizobiales bacterium 62-17]|nr:UDP-N-acetylmuramoyl-L-alanyl-D-glutamate--2,6-diaminopimelate ligase [Hyphomicrobiales bacterium]OJY03064.1 MAG: UDP-N-acetylmuramoyl-L-alanyl-D-glutamate--2,6-diaminopimelate ligase [Rhizobiales bacterium 62-17]
MAVSKLRDILPSAAMPEGVAALDVAGLTADSRAVRPGFVFFAVPGAKADGLSFAAQAQSNGAMAIVAERLPEAPVAGATYIKVADVRAALAQAAARFHARQPDVIAAITGTSGKTSTASFVRQIWQKLGFPSAALGTTGVVTAQGVAYGSLTTPDPITLHDVLDRLAGDGISHLAMEASSHGLEQKRLDGVRLAAGAFTNLSRDHLDYHPDMESYLKAKLRLFDTLLKAGQPAIVDVDGEYGPRVAAACAEAGLRVCTVGRQGEFIHIETVEAQALSTRLVVSHAGRRFDIALPLAGDFMASNALVAAAICLVTGGKPDAVFAALTSLEGAPGRLERVGQRHGAPIFVDYAHKPDALEKVLEALRPLAKSRLIVVFGCGGDRDKGKRPIMGAIAVKYADVAIVTDDNPRSENPATIRAEILAAAPGALEIGDRAQAIAQAVAMLKEGDVLVIAGKGHETGQIVGGTVLPFSDHEEARRALAEAA